MTSSQHSKLSLPRNLLPLAIFAYVVLCYALHPQSPLLTHQLLDTDDYTRLNQVINWLQSSQPFGVDWYNLSQPRLSPGEDPIIHWSRLVDLPIAFFMLPFINKFGINNAALLSSFIVPCLLFALLMLTLPAVVKPLVGRRRNLFILLLLLFVPMVVQNFAPGRVDHHAYQILFALCALSCLQRIVLCPDGWECSIGAALALAAGLWIGTEALPWTIIFIGTLAVLASLRGGFALRNAAVFGLIFPIAVGAEMPLAMQAEEFSSRALSWFSATDFIFAVLAGSVLILAWLGGYKTRNVYLRFFLMLSLTLMMGVLFLWQVPNVLSGVYADYDGFFNTTLLSNISEAQPFYHRLHLNIYDKATFLPALQVFLRSMLLPLMAALVVLWNLLVAHGRARTVWFIHGAFLLPAILLTCFWQMRVGWFAQAFCLAPLTWFFFRLVDAVGSYAKGRVQFGIEALIFFILAPLPVLMVPAILGDARVYPDLLLFPAARGASACSMVTTTSFLNSTYSKRPLTILSGVNEGPELLFRTPYNVLAGPYNVEGNRDTFTFFNAREDKPAIEVALRRNVDLILICRSIPYFYAGLADYQSRFKAALSMDSLGRLHITSNKEHPTLIERLAMNQPPSWLKPIPMDGVENFLLFEVIKQTH